MAKPTPREFDVVLFGATGFTGRLVAEYLASTHATHQARWALAGRDLKKLEAVRAGLAALSPALAGLPLLQADATDGAALEGLARRARVVCTTVGPYAKYGDALVAACVAAGTDYCDLTGETQWMRRTIDAHHARAQETGARIVHTCGFDSIPSDLGVHMLQEHARAAHGGRLSEVRCYADSVRGGASGGTVHSMLQAVDEAAKDPSVRRVMGNPYGLNPDPKERGPDGRDAVKVSFSRDVGKWTGPFVMASVNTRVVRRSNALLDWAYGRDFRYSEVQSFGKGPRGMLRAAAMTAGLGGFLAAANVPLLRRQLEQRVLPAPGEGPSKEAREKGFFVFRLFGEGADGRGGALRLEGKVAAKGDPGYAATSRMLGESALCLAQDGAGKAKGGVLTPATAMGMTLVERLRRAGMTFEVHTRGASGN
jgi:short subunit dehydrogenase-like uncharacterized protein